MTRFRRVRLNGKKRRGIALVETAVIAPFFLMLVLGIVEFGRAFMVSQLVLNAAREGARQAALDGETDDSVETFISDVVQRSASVSANNVSISLSVERPDGTTSASITAAAPRDLIHVDVSVPFSAVSFMPERWLQDSQLRGSSTVRKE